MQLLLNKGGYLEFQEQLAQLHDHAMIIRKGSVVVRQIFVSGPSCTGGIS